MRGVQRGITTTFIVLVILAGTVAITSIYLTYYQTQKQKVPEINSFEDCAKLYPVMESNPQQCNTPDGKHFTRQLSEEEKQGLVPPVQTSLPAEVTWASYQDEEVSLIYQDFLEVHKKESDVIREPSAFNNADMKKFIAFYAPQSDNGFFLQFWTNEKNLSVPEWWRDQFKSSKENLVFGVEQKEANLIANPKRVGNYDLYLVDNGGLASFELFRFKSYIILFVSSRVKEDNEKVLESLK